RSCTFAYFDQERRPYPPCERIVIPTRRRRTVCGSACTEQCSRDNELTEQTGTVYLSNAGYNFQTGSKLLKTRPIRENRTCSLGGGRRPARKRASSDPPGVWPITSG